jgi:hypothetical protein
VLRKELTGINQYFIHAKMCKNWGYERLYKTMWDESIGEMKHADEVIERLIFLEATPNMTGYDKISVGSNVKQQLENDMASRWLPLRYFAQGYAPAWKPPTTHRENCSSTSWWTRRSMSIGSRPNCTRSMKSARKII